MLASSMVLFCIVCSITERCHSSAMSLTALIFSVSEYPFVLFCFIHKAQPHDPVVIRATRQINTTIQKFYKIIQINN